MRRPECLCRRCRLQRDLRSAQLDMSLRGKERIDLIQDLRTDRARAPECPRVLEYENPAELIVQVLWPEKRWVTESVIMGWAHDAFANREIDHKPEDLEDAIAMLNDAGLITTGKKRDRKNPADNSYPRRHLQSFVDDLDLTCKESDIKYIKFIQEDTPGLEILENLPVYEWNTLWVKPDSKNMLSDFDAEGLPQIFIMHTLHDIFILVDTQGYNYPRYMGILPKSRRSGRR